MISPADRAEALLQVVTESLPHAEHRPGQIRMARRVADALANGERLVVQAGTGTGKTLGYLVPVIASGFTTIVATYTKALQDQLAEVDLPLLQKVLNGQHLADPFSWAVLKGRNNYLCRQRLHEIETRGEELELEDASRGVRNEVRKLVNWSTKTESGEMSEVPFPVSDSAWRSVSVGSDVCPGKLKCAFGETCYTERARDAARAANVVVVNFSLYGFDLEAEREFLPEHDVVVFDEVHELEDVISDTASVMLTGGSAANVAEAVRKVLPSKKVANALATSGRDLDAALADRKDKRLSNPLPNDLAEVLRGMKEQTLLLGDALTSVSDETPELLRAKSATKRLADALQECLSTDSNRVTFVTGGDHPRLVSAPLSVARVLAPVWNAQTAILTSATIPQSLPHRLGLAVDNDTRLEVESPFDYEANALLYLADDLPDPDAPDRNQKVHARIRQLVQYSDGSALVLFTSRKAMRDAVDELRGTLDDITVLSQDDMGKKALLDAFKTDIRSCLFATRSFFQGVDVPGDALRLVILDKVPFPMRTDPLLEARRDLLGQSAFMQIDVPIAAATLAQAAGRLIRSATDHGVVAILDSRLVKRRYKGAVLEGVAHFPETSQLGDVKSFFHRR